MLVPAFLPGLAAAESTVEPMPSAQAEPTADKAEPPAGPEAESAEVSRFRWGISGAGGPMVGAYSGGAGGIDARFGMQLSNMFGVYAQPILMVGAGASADANGASATGLALYGASLVADATFLNMFYVAGGPELLAGGVGTAAASSGGVASASASTGPFFSLAARAGLALGSYRPERRSAFTLGIDMHVIFAGGAAVLPMLALGYEAY
jgi:hypothetical protein